MPFVACHVYNLHCHGHCRFSKKYKRRRYSILNLAPLLWINSANCSRKLTLAPFSVAACTEKMSCGYGGTSKALLNVMSISCLFSFFRVMQASPLFDATLFALVPSASSMKYLSPLNISSNRKNLSLSVIV